MLTWHWHWSTSTFVTRFMISRVFVQFCILSQLCYLFVNNIRQLKIDKFNVYCSSLNYAVEPFTFKIRFRRRTYRCGLFWKRRVSNKSESKPLYSNILSNFRKFATCGIDGDVRIWSTNDSDDPTHYCVGEWALSVRQKGEKLYVATNNNDIQILALPEGERDGVLDRYVAPINQITVAKNKKVILYLLLNFSN